jgi:hypothetical protein
MSFSEVFSILTGIIFAISAAWYTIDVVKKKVTASIATFFMFTIINISNMTSLIAKNSWGPVPFTIVGAVTSALICIFALRNRHIYFELPDKIGIAGALIGVIIWIITKDATTNLYVIAVVETTVFLPLIIKSFKQPNLETNLPWQINLLASIFLLLTINSTAAAVWIVPMRQFLCSFSINIGLLRGQMLAKNKLREL